MLVREVRTSPPVIVGPGTSLKEAVRRLDDHQITAMPVVDDEGHLVGVLSEADVLRDSVSPDRAAWESRVTTAAG
jgi:CBS domain-containing protein